MGNQLLRVITYFVIALVSRQLTQGMLGVWEGMGFGLAWQVSWSAVMVSSLVVATAYPAAFHLYRGRKWSLWISGLACAIAATLILVIAHRTRLSHPVIITTLAITFIEYFLTGIVAGLAATAIRDWRPSTKTRTAYW